MGDNFMLVKDHMKNMAFQRYVYDLIKPLVHSEGYMNMIFQEISWNAPLVFWQWHACSVGCIIVSTLSLSHERLPLENINFFASLLVEPLCSFYVSFFFLRSQFLFSNMVVVVQSFPLIII